MASEYVRSLSKDERDRYKEKLQQLGFEEEDDPYVTKEGKKSKGITETDSWRDDVGSWPKLEFGNIYVYLIDSPGYSRESLKAYKSLEAYNFFISGWVDKLTVKTSKNGHCIIRGNVKRSQAVTDKPHQAWVGFKTADGTVVSAHCTCMAGLGLVCSHVAAIMFKVEAATRMGYNDVACTSLPCQWNNQVVKKIEGVPVKEVNFTKPKKNERKRKASSEPPTRRASKEATNALLMKLKQVVPNAVVFTVTSPVKHEIKKRKLPKSLGELYNEKNVCLNERELNLLIDQKMSDLPVSDEERINLEIQTRGQSANILWHKQRLGRITSSLFYECMHTNVEKPSESLLKKILNTSSFRTPATQWGLDNEDHAAQMFQKSMEPYHKNFKIDKCGFFLDKESSFLGSSPDRIVSCDCCGQALLEVKCPYKFRDVLPCSIADSAFCLENHTHEFPHCLLGLKKSHPYYYQVQGQLGICDIKTCYFVVFTQKGTHIERVTFDKVQWIYMKQKLTLFFRKCVMPRLLTNSCNI